PFERPGDFLRRGPRRGRRIFGRQVRCVRVRVDLGRCRTTIVDQKYRHGDAQRDPRYFRPSRHGALRDAIFHRRSARVGPPARRSSPSEVGRSAMKKLILLVALSTYPAALMAVDTGTDPNAQFTQANQMVEKGDADKALGIYQGLVSQGFES